MRLVNPVAERAILVGDAGRALELARTLLEKPLMVNHARGLWGYTGAAADGAPLTVQSTGTGGPSVAAVLRELHDAGVRRAVRAGSAAALDPERAPAGSLRAVAAAHGADGTTHALGAAGGPLRPDPLLHARAREAGAAEVAVVSVDLLPQDGGPEPAGATDAVAVDRSTAPFLAAAARLGVPAAAVLAFPPAAEADEERAAWWRAVGALAATALG
nr:hypothetical protein [Patulibacter sp. SYSU D01012]